MQPQLSEDEIDDLLYFARTGEVGDFNELKDALCEREKVTIMNLFQAAKDMSGNSVLHMAAANGHNR
jgi:hypothetical protein